VRGLSHEQGRQELDFQGRKTSGERDEIPRLFIAALLQRPFCQMDIVNPYGSGAVDYEIKLDVVRVLSFLQEERRFNGCPFSCA
jgi:hypothetical protein